MLKIYLSSCFFCFHSIKCPLKFSTFKLMSKKTSFFLIFSVISCKILTVPLNTHYIPPFVNFKKFRRESYLVSGEKLEHTYDKNKDV